MGATLLHEFFLFCVFLLSVFVVLFHELCCWFAASAALTVALLVLVLGGMVDLAITWGP